MTNSPLGQYAPAVAAITCAGTIAVYLLALVFGTSLAVEPAAIGQLHDLAILAFGAVVGSAVAVNGWKGPVSALHSRVDNLEGAAAVTAAAAGLSPAIANTHDGAAARSSSAPGDESDVSGV